MNYLATAFLQCSQEQEQLLSSDDDELHDVQCTICANFLRLWFSLLMLIFLHSSLLDELEPEDDDDELESDDESELDEDLTLTACRWHVGYERITRFKSSAY
jgi:hypothetical protein